MESTENTPPSSATRDTTKGSYDGEGGQFAFLVHSQDSVSENTPSSFDNQRLVRQKRRRTSPEDHAILEAEYEKNPKPDKTARTEIVNRVALGEKEVQIWFQNRRQMTRRKSRPLISTEIFSNFLSSQEQSDNADSSNIPPQRSSQQLPSSQSSVFNSQSTVAGLPMILPVKQLAPAVNSIVPQDKSAESSSTEAAQVDDTKSRNAAEVTDTSTSSDASAGKSQTNPTDLIRSLSQTAPIKRRPGYLANRRSAPFIIHDEQRDSPQPPRESPGRCGSVEDATMSSQVLTRTPSQVRLSLSLDGKAEVTTKTGMTPSPPRCQPTPLSNPAARSHVGLQRSYSALEPTNSPMTDVFPIPYSSRPMPGRSRDARTWEFYCDSDARNALTEQAEREEKGSATAAISLIRSHSYKSKIMTPNSNKRNAHTQKPDFTKRLKGDGKRPRKPKLARATSSVARLQTSYRNTPKQGLTTVEDKEPKSSAQTAMFQEYEGDSDKENWEPGTQTSHARRRNPADAQRAGVLEESLHVPSQSLSLDNLMNCQIPSHRSNMRSSSSGIRETLGSEVDDEVAAFMGETVPREEGEEDDLDCVQNLLSLSQAAWQ